MPRNPETERAAEETMRYVEAISTIDDILRETQADDQAYEEMLASGAFKDLAPGTLVVFVGGKHVLTTPDWDEAYEALGDNTGLITTPVPLRD